MSPFVHSALTYSQYVAPLMANFDTKGNNSEIALYEELVQLYHDENKLDFDEIMMMYVFY
jgi:ribosome maturation protein Sdo1